MEVVQRAQAGSIPSLAPVLEESASVLGVSAEASLMNFQNNTEQFLIRGAVNMGNSLPQYPLGFGLHGLKSIWTNQRKTNPGAIKYKRNVSSCLGSP